MKIDIAEAVKNEGQVYSEKHSGPFGSIDFLGERYDFPDGVHVVADYFFDGEGIVVTGSFETETQVSCSRCLKRFLYAVSVKFSEYYKEQEQDGVYTFEGEHIDLGPMLEDNLVLNLPSRHLCSEDCRGLCGKCGQDLNTGDCGCKDEIDETNPFYGLKNMTHDEEV